MLITFSVKNRLISYVSTTSICMLTNAIRNNDVVVGGGGGGTDC